MKYDKQYLKVVRTSLFKLHLPAMAYKPVYKLFTNLD